MELLKFDGVDVGYDEQMKAEFGATAKRFAREVVKHMGFKEFDISWNAGGIAVSGDVIIRGMYNDNNGAYVVISTPSNHGIMFRTIKNMRDYTGGNNNWLKLSMFENEKKVAEHIKNNTFGR